MLSGVRIFSSDIVWRQILSDLNATVLDVPHATDVNLDNIELDLPTSALHLKTAIVRADETNHILDKVFNHDVSLSRLQAHIVVILYQTGGISLSDLKKALGYAPDTSTHAVDTAIYQLRKAFGHEFITNNDGVYKLGRI